MSRTVINPILLGSPFPIGTIINSLSAPVFDGSTWLACDGSSQSKSTYATLFSNIGHDYMAFTPTISSGTAPAAITCGMYFNGTHWAYTNGATSYYYSSNGSTWSTVTLSNSVASPRITNYVPANTSIVYNTSGTAANISTNTNGSETWGTHTLPIQPSRYNIAPGNSTTNFLYVVDGSQTVYTMANGGTTWTTTASALPASVASGNALGVVWWDGTNWNVINQGKGLLYQTSTASGKGGWTTANSGNPLFYLQIFPTGNAVTTALSNAPNVVLLNAQGISYVSTTSLASDFISYPQPAPFAGVPALSGSTQPNIISVFWNGFCYVAIGSSSTTLPPSIMTSKDAKKWHIVTGITNANTLNFVLNITGAGLDCPTATNNLANTSNGEFLLQATLGNGSGTSSTYYTVLMTPTPTPSTQFSLPNIPGSYIRAL